MRFRNFLGALLAAASFSSAAAIPATETAELVEFYNASLDHYFITITPQEISDLDTGVHPGWKRTGYRFLVVKAGSTYAGSVPVCRFYGRPEKGIDSHFYSAKSTECEDVKTKFPDAWVFETAEAFRAFPVNADGTCPADTGRVNRLYNNRADVNHRYTDQPSVFFYMVGKGYTPEGDGNPNFPVAFCAPTRRLRRAAARRRRPGLHGHDEQPDAPAGLHADAHRPVHEHADQVRLGRAARAPRPRARRRSPSPAPRATRSMRRTPPGRPPRSRSA